MAIRAILLDFNGVIIDDEPIHLQAYREVLGDEGIEFTDEQYYASMGMNDKTFISSSFERAGKSLDAGKIATISEAKTNKWRDIIEANIPLFDGVENFVKKMSQELTLGIVSMAKRSEIDFVLEATGLKEYISVVVSAEDVSTHKPNPECFRLGFNLIDAYRTARGHAPLVHSECLVIEDSPAGIQAGKALGLPVLGIANTVSADVLRTVGADSVAKRLDDWMPETVRRVFV